MLNLKSFLKSSTTIFLVGLLNISLCSQLWAQVPVIERDALIALYNATDGPNWTNNTNWNTANPVSTWYGVTVVSNNVTQINIAFNQLSGTIPAEIGDFSNLTHLSLSLNQLTGAVPIELENLTNITWLEIGLNQLSGTIPVELSNLTNLTNLSLADNQLTGTIPAELGNLSNLTNLQLGDNQFSGTIPIELGSLSNLTTLALFGNLLTGSIPAEFGNLSNLSTLQLHGNLLTGSIPPELGNLSNLAVIYLMDNQLSGSIPPELGNMSNLSTLYLWNNQLSGTIPPELGNLSNLTQLQLYDNQLNGSIPIELGNLSAVNLTSIGLSGNQLTGSIPSELGNLTSLTSLQMNDNQLSGTIPVELTTLSSLFGLILSNNQFNNLPDFSGITTLGLLGLEGNFFEFDDLEPNSGITGLTYSPQNLIGVADTIMLNQGENQTLSLSVGGSANQYQWQKDGVDIAGATNDFLDLTNVNLTDSGSYNLLITSSLVPGLVLSSANTVVDVIAATPADYFWVGDGGVWTDLSHWSSTSGGSPDQIALPGKLDNVFFDVNSFSLPGQIVAIIDKELPSFEGETWKNMDWTGVTNTPTFQISTITSPWIYNNVYGSIIFDQNMALDFRGAEFYFYSDQDYVIDTKGHYLGDNCWLYVNAPEDFVPGSGNDVVCDVLSDINPAGVLIDKGTMRLNGHSLYEKDSYVWARGDGSVFDITGSYLDVSNFVTWNAVDVTIIDDDATIKVSTILQTDGVSYNHVILSDSAQVLEFSNSFDTLEIAAGSRVAFESEIVQNVDEFYISGTESLPISISATADSAAIFNKPTGTVNAFYASIKDNTGQGGAVFNAYASTDLGNTSGWNFRNTSLQDSLALASLFNATDGSNWFNNTNWNTSAPLGQWYGVVLNDSNRVSILQLANNNLVGNIPPEIGELTELKILWLGGNFELTGNIPPEIGQLQKLDTLGFSYSGVSGSIPETLYDLTNLSRLSLSNTQLTGSLSPSVSKLTNLKHIALWNSPLTGDIPEEFWDMIWLEDIYLGTNQQGGEISPKIGEFANLDEFWISQSNLSGTIPSELGNAGTTTLINLYNNRLTGVVPNEITNLNNLKTFNIQNNELDYLPDLSSIDSLQTLNISNNKFTYADILPNQSLITENTSQQPFGDSTVVQAYTFEGLRLDPSLEIVDGQVYQWFKEGAPLAGGITHYYEVADFREGDEGIYTLEVIHPDVPNLTLTGNPLEVQVNEGDPPRPQAIEVISPNGDRINDEMTIKNIELYPDHLVLIYDVLGRLVYKTSDYDNINNPFIGIGNINSYGELPSGTYYYLIDVGDTKKNGTGYFVMKRR